MDLEMNSDIIFEISKYADQPCGEWLEEVLNTPAAHWRSRMHAINKLEKHIKTRPTIDELFKRNIIKKEEISFSAIHDVLCTVRFGEKQSSGIAPSIAARAKGLDFYFKRRILIKKLGIDKIERDFKF